MSFPPLSNTLLARPGAELDALPMHLRASGPLDEGNRFQGLLMQDKSALPEDEASLRESAEALVSTAFVMPVLQMMHDSPWRPREGAFAPGAAEKRFSPLLDQRFADAIVKSANFPLVQSIVDRYLKPATSDGADHGEA